MTTPPTSPDILLLWQNHPDPGVSLEELMDMALTHAAFGQHPCIWLDADPQSILSGHQQLLEKLAMLDDMGVTCFYDQHYHRSAFPAPLCPGTSELRAQLLEQAKFTFSF